MKKIFAAVFGLMLMCSMTVLAADKKSDKAAMGEEKSLHGYIMDAKCAKEKTASKEEIKPDAKCAAGCIGKGEKAVFVNMDDKSIWTISNPESIKGHEGHHVQISAHVNAIDKTVHIMKVTMMPAETKTEMKMDKKS